MSANRLDFQSEVHELKCWTGYYSHILSGMKSFDVRRGDDRNYVVGDRIKFMEYNPDKKEYTGKFFTKKIVYVMHGAPFLPSDMWVLGLSVETDS